MDRSMLIFVGIMLFLCIATYFYIKKKRPRLEFGALNLIWALGIIIFVFTYLRPYTKEMKSPASNYLSWLELLLLAISIEMLYLAFDALVREIKEIKERLTRLETVNKISKE